ncbi:hypothetical protein [Thalassomonas sp. RHCl1]|uniref:hypothetical protein n=1 Tax=Thalassomonas sp. RHCl1 TaxID=2995320 RepID=UPI00248D0B29|nr:hypothetical protein [Thalassomonas sp. RHCl1]
MKKLLLGAVLIAGLTSAAQAREVIFDNVSAVNDYGWSLSIWSGAYNAYGFCRSKGFADAVTFTSSCGEDEMTFLNYADGRWVAKDSGSANRCYAILESVTCKSYQ